MKISHSDKLGRGKPSKRTFTARSGNYNHSAITFSRKTANDLGIFAGGKFAIYESESGDLYISVNAASGNSIKAGKAGMNNKTILPEYRVSDKDSVLKIMQRFKATKVVSCFLSALPIFVDDIAYYKVIDTPLRID